MNVPSIDTPRPAATSGQTLRSHPFLMLLKREYWEHRGGFLWAPIITGAVFLLFALLGLATLETLSHHAGTGIDIDFNNAHMQMSPNERTQIPAAVNALLYVPVKSVFITLAFVIFFYCVGALFDDRKDRSILFWKSLPISDRSTVLSKVVSATVVAPLIAAFVGLVLMLVCLAIASAWMAYHGGDITLLWSMASPLHLMVFVIGVLPVYAAWALPTIGWLMLASGWSRTKPFLWAVLLPVFAGILVSSFSLMQLVNLNAGWFWQHIVGRLLLSAVPGSELVLGSDGIQQMVRLQHGPEAISSLLTLRHAYASFATADMWIGIAVGTAMIVAAVRMRRWSDDS